MANPNSARPIDGEHPVLRALRDAPVVDPEPGELEALLEADEQEGAHPEERRTSAELRRALGL